MGQIRVQEEDELLGKAYDSRIASRLVGFDVSAEMLQVAAQNLPVGDHIELRQADGAALPAADGAFDAVFANMYLHHVPDPAQAIAEMARILKPGGRLVITDLDSHDQQWMRQEMADRWLGFDRASLYDWFTAAGLRVRADAGTLRVRGAEDPARITELLAAQGLYVNELSPERMDLERVFLDLTTGEGLEGPTTGRHAGRPPSAGPNSGGQS